MDERFLSYRSSVPARRVANDFSPASSRTYSPASSSREETSSQYSVETAPANRKGTLKKQGYTYDQGRQENDQSYHGQEYSQVRESNNSNNNESNDYTYDHRYYQEIHPSYEEQSRQHYEYESKDEDHGYYNTQEILYPSDPNSTTRNKSYSENTTYSAPYTSSHYQHHHPPSSYNVNYTNAQPCYDHSDVYFEGKEDDYNSYDFHQVHSAGTHHVHGQYQDQQQHQHQQQVRHRHQPQNQYRHQQSQMQQEHQYPTQVQERTAIYQDPEYNVPDIFSLTRHNRYDQVEALLDSGVPVDIKDKFGNTILQIAAQNGLKRLAKLALRRGANINTQNHKGNTPLHYCYAFKFGDTLGAYLISKGADPTIRNSYGLVCHEQH